MGGVTKGRDEDSEVEYGVCKLLGWNRVTDD